MATSPLHDALQSIFDANLRSEFADLVAQQDDLPEHAAAAVLADVDVRIASVHQLLEELSDAFDQPELYNSIAMLWLEQRFAWTRLNQVLQYSMVRSGAVDPQTFALAACVSGVVGALERVLSVSDRERLVLFASQPLEVGLQTAGDQQRTLERSRAQRDQAHALRTSVEQQVARVREWEAAPHPHTELEQLATGLSDIAKGTAALGTISLDTIWTPLLGRVSAAAPFDAPVFRVQLSSDARDVQLTERNLEALEHTLGRCLNELLSCTTYGEDAPGCVTISCELGYASDALQLVLRSDGRTTWPPSARDDEAYHEDGTVSCPVRLPEEAAA